MITKNNLKFLIVLSILIILAIFTPKERLVSDGQDYKAINKLPISKDIKIKDTQIQGKASYYDYTLPSGWSSINHLVCASRDFKRYSFIKVTNIDNGKSVICKVTDFGPDKSVFPDRVVDLSSYAFGLIADKRLGVIQVIVANANLIK